MSRTVVVDAPDAVDVLEEESTDCRRLLLTCEAWSDADWLTELL
jgi:hypothetical protein